MDVLRERIAGALWRNRYPGVEQAGPLADLALTDADAVIAALGLVERYDSEFTCGIGQCPEFAFRGTCEHEIHGHYWRTPWERIEEGA